MVIDCNCLTHSEGIHISTAIHRRLCTTLGDNFLSGISRALQRAVADPVATLNRSLDFDIRDTRGRVVSERLNQLTGLLGGRPVGQNLRDTLGGCPVAGLAKNIGDSRCHRLVRHRVARNDCSDSECFSPPRHPRLICVPRQQDHRDSIGEAFADDPVSSLVDRDGALLQDRNMRREARN